MEVCLKVGDLRDFVEEVTQKYWDYLSIGTIANGAKIKFERVPVSAICHSCENIFYFEWHAKDKLCCPLCGNSDTELYTGTELEVKEISIS
ncbi:MAG: hypA [Bacillota bacterium]|nr:hypA [Bacillota bacterium]